MSLDGSLALTVDSSAIEFAFTVENTGRDVVDLTFRSAKKADVTVSEDGVEVWSWSEERMFTQAIQTETLASGETFTHVMIWDDPSPGEYTATASLEATNASVVKRAEFEIS